MHEPTDRQALALRLIDEHVRTVGCPPTLRELGELMTIRSKNGVNDHLEALAGKGYLVRRERLARAILITDKGREYLAAQTKETQT